MYKVLLECVLGYIGKHHNASEYSFEIDVTEKQPVENLKSISKHNNYFHQILKYQQQLLYKNKIIY